MKAYLTIMAVMLLCAAAPGFAQTKAKAQNVPEIPVGDMATLLPRS